MPSNCPKCSEPRDALSTSCPYCGVIFAKYSAAARPSTAHLAALPPPPDPVWGVWHVNGRLKVARDARLPPRCIRCNRSTLYQVKYNAYWHPRGYYFFLLLGFWPYLFAYLLARRRFPVSVPLCPDHELARRNRLGLAVCLSGGGFVLMAIAMSVPALDFLTVVGFPAFAIGCVIGLRALRILKPTQITPEALYARGVSADYLNRLPISAG